MKSASEKLLVDAILVDARNDDRTGWNSTSIVQYCRFIWLQAYWKIMRSEQRHDGDTYLQLKLRYMMNQESTTVVSSDGFRILSFLFR